MVGEVLGGVVGGLFGDKGGSEQQQTATKEPWDAAAPWLRDLITQGQGLNSFYQRNPFNAIQQQGYQNLLGDQDYFRQTLAPQLLGFANQQMNTNYQRAPAGSELGGFLKPAQVNQPTRQTGGLLGALAGLQGMAPASAGMGSAGLMGQAAQQLSQGADGVYSTKPLAVPQTQQAYFSAPQGQAYGQINWEAMNPWSATNTQAPTTPAQPEETWADIVDRERRRREAGMGWQPGYGDM